jgi:hypothetical protein
MHCDPHYLELRTRFGQRIKALQWSYSTPGGLSGGLTLKDVLNGHKVGVLFAPPQPSGGMPGAMAEAMKAAVSAASHPAVPSIQPSAQ